MAETNYAAGDGARQGGDPRLPFHPATERFPLMSKTELAALAADIKVNGLHYAIDTLDTGSGPTILDGRNRYDACLMAGVAPHFNVLSNNTDPVAHLIGKNLLRRHSTMLERAIYAARMVTVEPGGDRKSEKGKSNSQIENLIRDTDAARRIGVSVAAVRRAGFILNHGVEELIEAIDDGVPWLSIGYADKLAHSSDEDQRKWLADKKHAITPVKRAARLPRVPIPWTATQLKALTDDQAAVIFDKIAKKATRGLTTERAIAIAKGLLAKHDPADQVPHI